LTTVVIFISIAINKLLFLMYSKETGYMHKNSCKERDLTHDHSLTSIEDLL